MSHKNEERKIFNLIRFSALAPNLPYENFIIKKLCDCYRIGMIMLPSKVFFSDRKFELKKKTATQWALGGHIGGQTWWLLIHKSEWSLSDFTSNSYCESCKVYYEYSAFSLKHEKMKFSSLCHNPLHLHQLDDQIKLGNIYKSIRYFKAKWC